VNRIFVLVGAVSAGLSVAAGAFGAHSLKGVLSPEQVNIFETAARYQMYHAFGLLIIGQMSETADPTMRRAGWCFFAGIVLFSGSLYLVALTGVRWFGAITPIGGAAFIAGWIAIAWWVWKKQR
jgi:uncharacterized membrane protein YgdD (TMEM256/DUF423 family)